jgi:hypothetical protein
MWSFLSASLHAQYFVVATCDKETKQRWSIVQESKEISFFSCEIISSIKRLKDKMQVNWLPGIDYYEHNIVLVFEDSMYWLNQNYIIVTATLAFQHSAYISVISKQLMTWVCIYLRSVIILYIYESFLRNVLHSVRRLNVSTSESHTWGHPQPQMSY